VWGTLWRVRVELSNTAEKQLARVPGHIVKKFALWVDLVTVEGLAAARAIDRHDSRGLRRGGQQT
jgi:hypothetical protein